LFRTLLSSLGRNLIRDLDGGWVVIGEGRIMEEKEKGLLAVVVYIYPLTNTSLVL
jgi:hypothetical protein